MTISSWVGPEYPLYRAFRSESADNMRASGKVEAVLGMLSIGHQTGWTGIIARMMHLFGAPKTGKCPRNWQGACAETTGDVQSRQGAKKKISKHEMRNSKQASFGFGVSIFSPFMSFLDFIRILNSSGSHVVSEAGMDAAVKDLHEKTANEYVKALRTEAGHVAAFLVWPVIGFAGAVIGG